MIVKIDASALKVSACARRLFLTVHRGYRQRVFSADLEYGSAFHKYIKIFKTSKPEEADGKALVAAMNHMKRDMGYTKKNAYKTVGHLLNTIELYKERAMGKDEWDTVIVDGKPLVELRFAIHYMTIGDVEFILCGTIDDICKNKRGCFAIRDYKTSSAADPNLYFRDYELSPQLLTYNLAVDDYAEKFPDSIFAEMKRTRYGSMIEGIFLRGKSADPEFIKSKVMFFSKETLDEFKFMLNALCKKIYSFIVNDVLPPREGMLNGTCNWCPFFDFCSVNQPGPQETIVKNTFVVIPYDPSTFGE